MQAKVVQPSAKKSLTSFSVSFLNLGSPLPSVAVSAPIPTVPMTPISIVFSVIWPSKPSLRVRSAVWIASSNERSSLYLWSARNDHQYAG